MADDALSRRRLLAASLGAAAAPGLAACSGQAGGEPVGPAQPQFAASPRNVRDFGAIGDGVADDTQAIARACADSAPVLLHFPAGHYLVSEWPDLPDYSVVTGDGGDVSLIVHNGEGTLIALRDRQRVSFRSIGIFVTTPDATAISLSNSFRCSFDSVVLRGNHLSDNHPQFLGQRGVVLDQNTGGTAFVNSDINNFGVGLVTSCIQNYVTSSKFTSNHVSVLGTGNDHNAGLSLSNVEFVSDTDPRTTNHHIRVDGAANAWWLINVWFEGADVALSIGDRDRGGPAQFGMVNCKVAARSVCLDLIYCRQPYLANVQFGHDLVTHPVELKIDPVGCPEGTAANLISSASDELDPSTFPGTWQVTGRRATDSLVLRDPAGRYWRLAVATDGTVETIALGDGRPPR
ncbi:glycosyl hydrolase family 28-related protein [Pseudonocardia cypriaca]|uniref:Pectate lyase-like protein n=1 Tax=Pseudonocardia cypriaca TaxID=882449 RepID=A0A543GAT2_9PSEU|nr:glycosyl hydrolase family 28-related protein [Pseudonocardia cypriaca]TQM43104.1 pectate lyase-like protein [Pseudonocardia cypriaca]